MKFSERWLREWVDPPVDADRLCQQLTRAGLEVDAAEAAAPDLTGVVVGRITVCEPHPQADHLSVCRVDCGGHGQRSIVCGAPNAAVDLVAPVALPGAQLPTVGEIAETTLHGVTSQGMLCSAAELGLGEEGDRLMSLDPEAVPGTPLADHLGLPDRVIDIDLTPNRGDCLSLRGVAREVAVWNRLNFNHPDCSPLPAEHEQQRDVSIENLDQCSAYAGRVLIGTDTNARTPDWLRERLRRAGLRSLGVAVDVTNYVMLELGQPMHAFDLARLAGGIQVRQARAGESLRLLDETEVVLDPSTLVIADDDGPVAMAGVMGGAESAVSANTRDLFLESACFAPAAVAGLGRRCRVHSESLHRFERGVDPQLQQAAMERATALIQSIAGGACGPVTVAGGPRKATAAITLRRDRLQRLLGSAVAEDEIVDILTRLCMKVTAGGGAGIWQVVPPSHRHDLHLEADLIEEVARIHGYDRLQARKRPVFAAISAPPAQQRSWPELRAVLLQQGYDEAVSYSFVNADLQQALCPDLLAVDLDNPIAAPYAQMRTTLWSSLLPCWLHNRRRQQTRVRLFERGLRFARARGQEQTPVETMTIAGLAQGDAAPEHWSRAARPVDFFDVKGDIARLFGRHAQALRFTREAHAALHPGRSARIHFRDRAVGWVGQLHPKMKRVLDDYEMPYVFELDSNALETRPAVGLESMSDYPELRRDLALVVDEAVTAGDLLTAIEALGMKTLRRVKVFDLFRGAELEPGCKSLALGLIFQDKSRTLIASSVDAAVGEIVETLQERCGARVRGQ